MILRFFFLGNLSLYITAVDFLALRVDLSFGILLIFLSIIVTLTDLIVLQHSIWQKHIVGSFGVVSLITWAVAFGCSVALFRLCFDFDVLRLFSWRVRFSLIAGKIRYRLKLLIILNFSYPFSCFTSIFFPSSFKIVFFSTSSQFSSPFLTSFLGLGFFCLLANFCGPFWLKPPGNIPGATPTLNRLFTGRGIRWLMG